MALVGEPREQEDPRNTTRGAMAAMTIYSAVTLFARFRGLLLRPALRALTWLRQFSLRRKPRNSRTCVAVAASGRQPKSVTRR